MRWYSDGAISLANGSTAAVGSLTAWLATAKIGDALFAPDGKIYEIAEVASNTSLTIAKAYQGATVSAAAYSIQRGPSWSDASAAAIQLAEYIGKQAELLHGTGAPASGLGSDGAIYFRDDTPEFHRNDGGVWSDAVSMVGTLTADDIDVVGLQNLLINGNGAINQRAATSQADDTYAWDRWYVLTQTAAVGVSTLSNVTNGLPSMMRLTQTNATAQRMGVAQIMESANSRFYRNKKLTLGGSLRYSAPATVRYAILEWTGTADAVTSDVVLSWTSTTFAAGGFFLASNVTVAAAGSLALAANTLTDFALTATISSSCNNLIVLFWTDAAASHTTTLDLAAHLFRGEFTAAAKPAPRLFGAELALCQRFYEFHAHAVPMVKLREGDRYRACAVSWAVTKRTTPTLTQSYAASGAGALTATPFTSGAQYVALAVADANTPYVNNIYADAEL